MERIRLLFLTCTLMFSLLVKGQQSTRANLRVLFTDSVERQTISAYPLFPILEGLYIANNYLPIFTRPLVGEYLNHLVISEKLGFHLSDYNFALLDSLHHSKEGASRAFLDIEIAHSYIAYLDDVRNGILKSEMSRGDKVHFQVEEGDAYAELNTILQQASLSRMNLAEPSHISYQKTKENLLHLIDSKTQFGEELVWSDTLSLGDKDSMVLKLKNRLKVLGDYTFMYKARSMIFDKEVKQALQDFQFRNLMDSTGLLDAATVDLLNMPIDDLIDELQLNLERWRWLPQDLGEYYAFANLPSFEMRLVKNDTLLLEQKMVCGKPSRSTPSFNSLMSYLDINPTWTVPPTILQNDILPAVKKNSNYLPSKNMKVLDLSTGEYVKATEINWAKSSNYRFIQGPGLTNSLGSVKFIFPNPYYIFFHDTPHKEHFPMKYRAHSSGCVRLSQPKEFAAILLAQNSVSYNLNEIDSIIDTEKTRRILLEDKPMVYVHYLTQEYKNGVLFNYPDVYGYNEKQLSFLSKGREELE